MEPDSFAKISEGINEIVRITDGWVFQLHMWKGIAIAEFAIIIFLILAMVFR